MGKRFIVTEELKNDYLAGKQLKELAKKYRVATCTLSRRLKEIGITIRRFIPTWKKYDCNTKYFDRIDTAEKAYWLGFITAEGWLCYEHDNRPKRKSRFRFGLEIGLRDVQHLRNFKKAIESKAVISKRSRRGETIPWIHMACIRIANPAFCHSLLRYFPSGRKASLIKFPVNGLVPHEFLWHFIRGYFDGDGCITKEGILNFTSNAKDFLVELQKFFVQQIAGFQPRKVHKYKGRKCYKLVKGTLCSLPVYEAMYKNATIYLKRKYKIYCRVFNKPAKQVIA